MDKKTLRLWMIVAAGLAGGFFALLGAVATLPARVAVATLGGIFAGLGLYLYGKFQRL